MLDGHTTLEWYHLLDRDGYSVHNGLAQMTFSQVEFVNQISWMTRLGWTWKPCLFPNEHIEHSTHYPQRQQLNNFNCLPPSDRPDAA